MGEPPTKKRRFFADSDLDTQDRNDDSASNRGAFLNDHGSSPAPPDTTTPATSDPPTFDKDAFEGLLGENVKPEVLDIISAHCGNSLEQAVNMYFDGTWMKYRKLKPTKPTASAPSLFPRKPTVPMFPTATDDSKQPDPPPPTSIVHSMPESRYIGAFGVEGWATRSGASMLNHGDMVRIERQKTNPAQSKGPFKRGAHVPLAPQRASPMASKRVDVVVRFTDTSGREIGRLAKDTANWVSSLIDQKVCRFEGICVYAPERLRTNDTIFLQLKCYILKDAFLSTGFQLTDNRHTGLYEEKETAEERDLRLRQIALVRLFQEINLMPTRSSDAAEKHKREGLLQAAETADKQEKSAPKSNDRYVNLIDLVAMEIANPALGKHLAPHLPLQTLKKGKNLSRTNLMLCTGRPNPSISTHPKQNLLTLSP